MKKFIVLLLGILLCVQANSYIIQNINIQGNNNIISSIISLSLPVKSGDKISNDEKEIKKLQEEIKESLISIGFFGNAAVQIVPISMQKADLNIQVLEFPIIKEIIIETDLDLDIEEIKDIMATKEGEILNINDFRKDLVNLRKYFMDAGIMLGGKSNINLNETFDKVYIKIFKATVDSIEVTGNKKTRLNVITRELEFEVGDPYDFVDLRRSYQNLANTGYFTKVDFMPQNNKNGNIDLKIDVAEEETGQFRFGGTYGDENGLSGLIEVSDKNFKGRGINLKLKAEFGGMDNYEFGYYNPRWRDKKISQGINIYRTKYERDRYDNNSNYLYTYDELRKGYNISWGMHLTKFTKFGMVFYDEDVEIDPQKPDLKNDHLQSLRFNISKDIRDNVFYPEFGYYTLSSIEFTGGFLKGADDYSKYISDFRYYKKLSSKLTVASRLKYGKIDVRDGTLEDYEQFSMGGGTSIRGYKSREFHGNELLLSNTEFRWSFGQSFNAFVFLDKGHLDFDSNNSSGEKTGVGLGIMFKTPFGMIRLDWGNPDESGRKTKSYFNFGTMF